MFTRVVHCTLKPERRSDFNKTLQEKVLPEIKTQPGFVSLIGMMSDEKPNHALAITFWNTKQDADRYYQQGAPMLDYLTPLVDKAEIEHFTVDKVFEFLATGKAA